MKYVYACISFKNKNEIKDITQTRKYKKAETIARILKADKFVTDVCVGRKRDKDNFEQLISERENVIIVPDITCLGKNNEIARLYNRILESKNDLLVCYFDEAGVLKAEEISTVNGSTLTDCRPVNHAYVDAIRTTALSDVTITRFLVRLLRLAVAFFSRLSIKHLSFFKLFFDIF